MSKQINFVFDWIGPKGPIPNNLSPSVIDLAKAMGFYQPAPNRNSTTGQNSSAYDLLRYRTKQVTTCSTSHLPDQSFVYEYNHYWWESAEEFFGAWKLNGFLSWSNQPPEVFDRIKTNSAFLLVTIPLESPMHDHQLIKLDDYFRNYGLPSSQIIYLTCCANGKDLYLDFCQRYNREPLSINFEYLPFYFSTYHDQVQKRNIEYQVNIKKKTFLMFNRRWGNHPQRVLMLCHLFKNNLLDDFYISFSKDEVDNKGSFTTHAQKFLNYLSGPNLITDDDLALIETRLPLILDHNKLEQNLMFTEFTSTQSFYNNSMIHVIAETYFFSNLIHLTEKSYKPIAYKQPFIMFASPGSLNALRQQGFKTFSSLWDESYDDEKDHTKRFFKILDLMKEISSWTEDRKLAKISEAKEIVEYNFEILKNNPVPFLDSFINKYGA